MDTKMCERMANEAKQKADPEAWRAEYLAKQAAGVRFAVKTLSGEWVLNHKQVSSISDNHVVGVDFNFEGKKEDYREVPQEVQKEGDMRIPEASREVLKQWQANGLKFNVRGIAVRGVDIKFTDIGKNIYTISEQPIPEGMSVEMVEAMWRQGLMLEFDGNFGWDLAADGFDWNGIYRGAQLLARLRIPAQPIPEKLLEVSPPTPHAAERALWKAQRDAGTNEVWQAFSRLSKTWCDLDNEPKWYSDTEYRVKPMKLTAIIMRKNTMSANIQAYEFFGTREEYRAECEKYGYAILSEIKEVVEKHETVKYYFVLFKTPGGRAGAELHKDKQRLIDWIKKCGYTIIGDIEEREIEA